MDDIFLDRHGRLTLTPLNMMLSIFSTETQKSNKAWETIYFHPNLLCFTPKNWDKKSVPFNNIQNLHRGLDAALCLFKVNVQKPLCFLIFLGTTKPTRYQ